MSRIITAVYDDLIIKSHTLLVDTYHDYFDMNRNFNIYEGRFEGRKNKEITYSVISYKCKIGKKNFNFISPKLNIDADNLKIKLYMKGSVEIICNDNLTEYRFDLNFLI